MLNSFFYLYFCIKTEGDVVAINFDTGVITDETTGQTFQAAPFPPFIQKIIKAGGLMKSIQEGK